VPDGMGAGETPLTMKTDFSNPQYSLDKYGKIWLGPTNPESTMHYSYFCGFDVEQNTIWVLSRTEEPEDTVQLTEAEAQFLFSVAKI